MVFLQMEAFGEPRTFLWRVTLDQSWRIFPARKDWRWGRRSVQNSGWTVNCGRRPSVRHHAESVPQGFFNNDGRTPQSFQDDQFLRIHE